MYEHETSYKDLLQKNFTAENELRTMQLKCRDQELVLTNYHKKIIELEKEREDLLDRIDEIEKNYPVESPEEEQTIEKHSLIEIQSLITQVNQLLDKKALERNKSNRVDMKFKASIECLQRAIAQ